MLSWEFYPPSRSVLPRNELHVPKRSRLLASTGCDGRLAAYSLKHRDVQTRHVIPHRSAAHELAWAPLTQPSYETCNFM